MTTFMMFSVFNSFLEHHFLLLFPCTVGPRYNAPRYNADSGITRSTVAPENKPARGRFFFFFFFFFFS